MRRKVGSDTSMSIPGSSKLAQCLTNGKFLLKTIEKNFNVPKNLNSFPTGLPKAPYLSMAPPYTYSLPPSVLPSGSLQSFNLLLSIPQAPHNDLCLVRFFPPSPNPTGLPTPDLPLVGIQAEVRSSSYKQVVNHSNEIWRHPVQQLVLLQSFTRKLSTYV